MGINDSLADSTPEPQHYPSFIACWCPKLLKKV